MSKVYLDFGHGGNDPGAVGNNLKEKDLTLSIGLEVGRILKRHGVEIVYSRTTDATMSLKQRSDKANANNVDVFVSIHINSFTNRNANGVETFSHTGSKRGLPLAKAIQDSLVSAKIFKTNRGTKTANFHVLRETKAPAALTELGFISNTEDAQVLKTKQKEIAIAIAKGILSFLKIKYKAEANKPSTPEIPNTGDLYKVQVGAYSIKANADKKLAELKAKGFEGYIKKE
ncbi:N-acetylmuramoyl-L-alanine amidase [Tissierella creatinophila]|uniref:Sporulation-specific N-acetylmuramoyl-L-alanine amidase n=1 Tax=Tissierella creatinophila DSM 6911 TaxID=1123403 RepID=A0A1U7M4P3_TISCR|nr:N-acetylmuramoyl-L-alanine amidase [Tissierella creatinophila]OLS02189.1 sporulation-specific N-acetylmuramoyl-L-alanine amidase [Tissierella creatinophila DSM 6911]